VGRAGTYISLRERALWRLLYDSGARAESVLGLDVPDLDLGNRHGRACVKGGHVRPLHFQTGAGRLLARLTAGREADPVFLTAICAAECRDGFPDHGSYRSELAAADSPEALLASIESRTETIPDQWQIQVQARIQARARVGVHTSFLSEGDLRSAHFQPVGDIADAVAVRLAEAGPEARSACCRGPADHPVRGGAGQPQLSGRTGVALSEDRSAVAGPGALASAERRDPGGAMPQTARYDGHADWYEDILAVRARKAA
jgi:hypothetical protein